MFKNILVPLHIVYKKNHTKLFTGALELLDEDGTISLLYVNENRSHTPVYPILDDDSEENVNHEALLELKKIAIEHNLPKGKVTFHIRSGSVHSEILAEERRMNADAIVMMATKPGFESYFISSTAERVIRHANCSIFVMRLDEND